MGDAMNLLQRVGVVENNGEIDQSEKPELDLTLSLGGSSSVTIGKFNADPPSPKMEVDRPTYSAVNAESEPRMMLLKELQTMRRIETVKRLVEQRNARTAVLDVKPIAFAMPPPPLPWGPPVSAPPSGLWIDFLKLESVGLASGNITPIVGGQGSQLGTMVTQILNAEGSSSEMGNPLKRARIYSIEMEEEGMNQLRQMPSVSTIGEGPYGKKIEGFLFKYEKQRVCIMCDCHGIYLSPEEFVMHAGGYQVANPMKQIKVVPTFY